MDPLSAALGGGVAGLLGAALAHVLAVFCDRLGSESWLRGPYGPQFFNVALYTGVFYAAIAAAAGRRASVAAAGFLGSFLGILVPMFVLTRYGGWGMPRGADAVTLQWKIAVLVVYIVSIWGTIAGVGALSGRAPRWRGALEAVGGSLAGYAVLTLALKLLPFIAKGHWSPTSFLPPPVNLLDGLLSGAGLCLALSLDDKLPRRKS
ncbi:MAG: hypothetical protein HY079_03130 [Elusimicrobia bacterium]|nr:hypothetical protein [Elusimicrobiota bacterium]